MKRFLLFLLCSLLGKLLTAQSVDVTAYSQNVSLQDTSSVLVETSQQLESSYPPITETYQIPSYDLYDQYWDVNHLRSRMLTIPFTNDRLMLILVQSANNPFELPCVFDEIMLNYGPTKKGIFHPGVDLKVEPQTLVKSCFDGVVRMAKNYGDYGLMVVIRHYNGLETVYAHLDKICVKPGQMVYAGAVIGQTGCSGNAKDYMLHFETRFMNEFFDPSLIIDFENETLVKNTLVLMSSDLNVLPLEEVGNQVPSRPAVPQAKPQPPVPKPQPQAQSSEVKQQETPPTKTLQNAFDGEEEYHVVQKGETLYRIATNHQTTVDAILKLNNIKNADMISEGQRLRIR